MGKTFKEKMKSVETVIRKFGITEEVKILKDDDGNLYCEISPFIIRERIMEEKLPSLLMEEAACTIRTFEIFVISTEYNYPREPNWIEKSKIDEKLDEWDVGAEIVNRMAKKFAYDERADEMMLEMAQFVCSQVDQ